MNKTATHLLVGTLACIVAFCAAFWLGLELQPGPDTVVVAGPTVEVVRLVEVPVPGATVVETVYIEREAIPQPTDCVVMRWLDGR